jgi:sphinganine-1-phosphate aldolase
VAVGADGDDAAGGVDPFTLADRMRRRGWFVQPQPAIGDLPRNVHLTVQPTSVDTVEQFVEDLAAAAEECRDLPWAAADPELAAAAATLDHATLDEATVAGLLEFAGLGGSDGPGLPDDSAGIQALLESLPAPLRDRLLAGFFSTIFTGARQ